MIDNYYINSNGDYVEKTYNRWKSGYSNRGRRAMKKHKYKVYKRQRFFMPIKNFFKRLFTWKGINRE